VCGNDSRKSNLDRHKKRRNHIGRNHAGIFRQIGHQWFGNKGIELLGKRHHTQKADNNTDDDPHHTAAQL